MASQLTTQEKRKIAKLAREGLSAREIARHLGGRSHNTVSACMSTMGLGPRARGNAAGAVDTPKASGDAPGPASSLDASKSNLVAPWPGAASWTPSGLGAAAVRACGGDVGHALLLLREAMAELGGGDGDGESPDLTMADVRGWVSSQMRDLQAEAKRCEMGQDPDGAATARRMLTAIAPLAARVALKDPADDGEFVRVKSSDMDAAALKGREKLQDMLTKALAERAGWPRCAECGQPVRPAEGGESCGR